MELRAMAGRIAGTVDEALVADGADFVSRPVERLALALEGVVGDAQHFGFTRKSGGREPWHPRGTVVANDRQVSVVCPAELAIVAERMEIDRIEPGWIGANLVVSGVERLSFLPRGTRLAFPSGATLFVTDQNGPCRFAGASIARNYPGRSGLDLLFPKVAQGLRGFVAMVERAGMVQPGEAVSIMLPARQWIYEAERERAFGT
jgi:MOSC domain-containing protein YiiM